MVQWYMRDWIWSCVTEFGHAWLNLVTRDWIWSRVRSIHKWRVWDFGHLQLPPWAQRPSGPLEAKRCLNCVSWRADPGSEVLFFVRETFKKDEKSWEMLDSHSRLEIVELDSELHYFAARASSCSAGRPRVPQPHLRRKLAIWASLLAQNPGACAPKKGASNFFRRLRAEGGRHDLKRHPIWMSTNVWGLKPLTYESTPGVLVDLDLHVGPTFNDGL